MKKVYRRLTKDQVERGVVFSSTLSRFSVESEGDLVKEVFADTDDKERIIRNLKDDSFFDGSPWRYNIIRK